MENAKPGTIVYVNDEVYIIKRKLGPFQCRRCAMLKTCRDHWLKEMHAKCFYFLCRNPINPEDAALILRKPFKLTVENMGKYWPQHSVLEWDGEVGIIVTNHDMYRYNLFCSCSNCILFGHGCNNFRCTTAERGDGLSTVLMPIEMAIFHKMVQVIKTNKNND